MNVLFDILTERNQQDIQWGGPSHDDTHVSMDWLSYIDYQTDKAIRETAGLMDEKSMIFYTRDRFMKIAALAIAALESIDRKFP